jgi:pilus assembly protein FimV
MTPRKTHAFATTPALKHWLGAALLGMGCLSGMSAHALSLGRLQVLSSLGESLRAEVEVLALSPEEANSFKATMAGAETARALGITASPGLNDLTMTLQRLPDGRATLVLTGASPVTEPFVELALEISWTGGKLTRNYTLLFTPPQANQVLTPLAPALQVAPQAQAAEPAPAAAPAPTPAPAPVKAAAAAKRLTVQRGDTASQLAVQAKALNVSLDQMLLAMLRANPDAFVGGNVNRLKAGAVIELPSAEQALALNAAEARQTITLQSQDFNAFRQQLASNAKAADVAPAGRAATGKVQSALEEKTPAAAAPDKLTLSKGALQGGASAEEKLSQQRKAKDADERLAELSKNIRELNELGQSNSVPAAAGSQATAEAPAAQSAVSAPAAAAPASAVLPAVALPAVKAAVAPNLIDRLAQHPAVLPAAGALLSVLLAWILVRSRRNRAEQDKLLSAGSDELDASPERLTELAPMTDAALTAGAGFDAKSSLAALSALTTAAPLPEDDPLVLARAELARGRDLQAEAILRMALEQTPLRMDLLLEMMDLCVERQDSAAFEALAVRVLGTAGGPGPEWPLICLKGQLLDPTNPLYAPTEEAPRHDSPFDNLDFDLELNANTGPADASVSAAPAPSADNTAQPASRVEPARAAAPSGEFDMSSLSLDLPTPPASASDNPPRNAP